MQLLKDKIVNEGTVKPGGVLKVDSFLNHQIDISLYNEMGKEFARLFEGQEITKILTIEASGIGIACIAAQYFNVPVVFAKKMQSKNLDGDIYTSEVHSFTHGKDYTIRVSKKFISETDKVLIIDDFLANGKALIGLIDILNEANATLVGAGIAIEKGFQEGGKALRDKGINIQSLAIIKEMDEERIVFED
ncbi:MAG: xanthine phosphoribosyltransferase [Clostridia bacterium]|jgi:xanthine phosphoribosyltransferase|nr:xanthine phosphoribosyltransferase [Clostridia bacterium]